MKKDKTIVCHEDPDLFREAVTYTAADTGFTVRLIEKDYFCSALLAHLSTWDDQLIFKGGTCLTKIHAGFYRLSEDLDFSIPMSVDAPRSQRSQQVRTVRQAISTIERELDCFHLSSNLQGANNSTQYNAMIRYRSLMDGRDENIKIEIGLREPLLRPSMMGQARTILLDPISGESMAPFIPVRCISKTEALAEKCRAAMTRREIAIRDFYDIANAVTLHGLDLKDTEFIALVAEKLAIPGNETINMGSERKATLIQQLEARLRPVLREKDFSQFDLDLAFAMLLDIAGKIAQ